MQIVINIHEKDYQSALRGHISFAVLDAIQKAIVLPEHGRLIDADALIKEYGKYDIGVFVKKQKRCRWSR